MAGLDEAKDVDLAQRAEELAKEAERLREADLESPTPDADKKLSASIESLRKIARKS
jgi:hypothetical protein